MAIEHDGWNGSHKRHEPLARIEALGGRLWTRMRQLGTSRLGPTIRRGFDVGFAAGALVAAAPVLTASAALVKATSKGPAFYSQVRVGQGGRSFTIYKLRSMFVDADQQLASLMQKNESRGGVTFKMRRDPRITPVGRILRKLSIDELPQLWNVLNGTMSVFGPRPPLPREVKQYGSHERRRLEVKPGLTCLWQVSGRSDLSFEQQVELDLQYIDTSTPKDEARLLLKSIPVVLTGRGAY